MKRGELVTKPVDGHYCDLGFNESRLVPAGTPMLYLGTDDTISDPYGKDVFLIAGKVMVWTPYPLINLRVQSVPVYATTYKLKARWSPMAAKDIGAYHCI